MNATIPMPGSRNISIDVGRFICAFLVVALHTRFPIPQLNAYLSDVGKIAVPFFLLVSGFYLYDVDASITLNKTRGGARKIGYILVQSAIAYGILRFIKSHYFNIDISSQDFNLLPFLLFNDTNFTEHLWYLFAYFYVLIIIGCAGKFARVDWLLYSIPILFTIHFTFTTWSRFVPMMSGKVWYELNWLVLALPFVVAGMVVRKNISSISRIGTKGLLTTTFLLFVLVFLEHYAFKQFAGRGPGVFAISFLAITAFIYCARNGVILGPKLDGKFGAWGREHALNIYIYHIFVRESLSLANVGLWANNTICIFVLSFALSIAIIQIKSRIMTNTVEEIN